MEIIIILIIFGCAIAFLAGALYALNRQMKRNEIIRAYQDWNYKCLIMMWFQRITTKDKKKIDTLMAEISQMFSIAWTSKSALEHLYNKLTHQDGIKEIKLSDNSENSSGQNTDTDNKGNARDTKDS